MRRSISWLPGKGGCCREANRVLVRSGRGKRKVYAGGAAGVQRQLLQQTSCPLRAALRQNIVQRIQPLPGFQNFHSIGLASQPRLVFSINECGTFHDSQLRGILLAHGRLR